MGLTPYISCSYGLLVTPSPPASPSCCGGSALDYRGRRLGSVCAVEGSSAQVRWQGANGLGQVEEISLDPATKQGLLQVGALLGAVGQLGIEMKPTKEMAWRC